MVDISLSMKIDKQDLINDINKYIETYNNHYVSVYFVNHVIDDVKYNVKYIKDSDFDFRGRTALWESFDSLLNIASYDVFPIFIIYTDGKDTASQNKTQEDVYSRVVLKKLIGWKFIYPYKNPFSSSRYCITCS